MEVKAVALRLSLFVLDPRLSLELMSLLRKYGVDFRAPAGLSDLCYGQELLIVDEEGLNYVKENGASVESCLGTIVISRAEEIYTTLLARILDTYAPISIGIDLGKRIAYAVLVGGRLLAYDYVDRVEEIKGIIKKLNAMKPRVVLLGIGAEYLRELPREISEVLESENIAAAYIIEEERVNKTVTPRFVGTEADGLPEDLRAAIAIAIKVYEKYVLTRSLR